VTSQVYENLSDVQNKIGDIQRIELGAKIAGGMILFPFSFP
jgi:hypothetical protein